MKFFSIILVLVLAKIAMAVVQPQISVIVSYSDSTPDSVIEQAKDAIKADGGFITHEYKLIKGFAAKAPVKVLEMIQTWGNDYHAVIEEDQVISVAQPGVDV